jgi:magnesium chelatase subunit I
MRSVIDWFDLGGTLPLTDTTSADDVIQQTRGVGGLRELADKLGLKAGAPAPVVAAYIDFVLEGLCAQRKISRSDDRGYMAGEEAKSSQRPRQQRRDETMEEDIRIPGGKKKYYN